MELKYRYMFSVYCVLGVQVISGYYMVIVGLSMGPASVQIGAFFYHHQKMQQVSTCRENPDMDKVCDPMKRDGSQCWEY